MRSPVFQYLILDDCISKISSLFRILFRYWDACSKRHREYTLLQVEFLISDLFQVLFSYWRKKKMGH